MKKNSLGRQLVRAADSVAANLSEGYGRYHYKENRQFAYYSRGSLYETKTWLKKAQQRELITSNDYENLIRKITILMKQLNSYIKSIGQSSAPTH
ncbi:MAG: four helix bundle protein [Candidatus Neomarinimicrobiota bacterium]